MPGAPMQVWRAKAGRRFTGRIVVAGATIYGGSVDRKVYAVDLGQRPDPVVLPPGRADRRRRGGLGRYGLRGKLTSRGPGLRARRSHRPAVLAHFDRSGRRAARPDRQHARGRDPAGRGDRLELGQRVDPVAEEARRRADTGRASRQRHRDRGHGRLAVPDPGGRRQGRGPGILAGGDPLALARAPGRARGGDRGFPRRRRRSANARAAVAGLARCAGARLSRRHRRYPLRREPARHRLPHPRRLGADRDRGRRRWTGR